MLLANQAFFFIRPSKTNRAVNFSKPQACLFFLNQRQLPNCARGTNLAAQLAVVFTIPDLGNKLGRPNPGHAGFHGHRLKAVGDAHLHAIAAADAGIDELVFR